MSVCRLRFGSYGVFVLNVEELAQLIEELETRVERLRAVYEQYFMGIERLEPLICARMSTADCGC